MFSAENIFRESYQLDKYTQEDVNNFTKIIDRFISYMKKKYEQCSKKSIKYTCVSNNVQIETSYKYHVAMDGSRTKNKIHT